MPCRGLPSLAADLKDGVFNRISLREFAAARGDDAGKARVVVDGVALLYFILSKTEWSFGGEGDAIRQATLQFCATLRRIGVSLLVLFDGVVSHNNFTGGIRKSSDKLRKIAQAISPFESQPFRHAGRHVPAPCLPPFALEVVIEALHSAGVHVRVCEAECSRYVHGVAASSNVMLVGYDSNYLCTRAPGYIHCDSLARTRDGDVVANLVVPEKFAAALGIAPAHLPLLTCVLGNEVSPEWAFARFHRALVAGARVDDRREVVAAVANWLAQQDPERKNEDIFEDVIRIELDGAIGGAGLPSNNGGTACVSHAQFSQATIAQRAEILRAFYRRSSDLLSPLPLRARLSHSFHFFEAATAGAAPPPGISSSYFAGDFSAVLLSVLTSGVAWIRPCLEGVATEVAAADVGLPLRAAAYGVVFSDGSGARPSSMTSAYQVREAVRVGSEYTLRPVEPRWTTPDGEPMPSWNTVTALDKEARQNLLFDLCGATNPAQKRVLREMDPAWVLVGLALAVLESNADMASWETLALVEHIVAPASHAQLCRLHHEGQLARGPEEFHRGAQWQHTLLSIMLLNTVLGFPIATGSALARINRVDLRAEPGRGHGPEQKPNDVCLAALFNGMAFCHARADARSGRSLLVRHRATLATAEGPSTACRSLRTAPGHVVASLRRAHTLLRAAYAGNEPAAPAPKPKARAQGRANPFAALAD